MLLFFSMTLLTTSSPSLPENERCSVPFKSNPQRPSLEATPLFPLLKSTYIHLMSGSRLAASIMEYTE